MTSTRKKLEKTNLKVGELYMETLLEYQKKFDKKSLAVFMQVGSFFEMYGFIYPDGTKVGNIWEISDQLGLKVSNKEQLVYNNPKIKMVMSGVPEVQINKFIQLAVDKYNWTVVIFEQKRIGTSSRYERVETGIYSPGININSDGFSNICMNIYIEQIKNYVSLNSSKFNNNSNNDNNNSNNNSNNDNSNNNDNDNNSNNAILVHKYDNSDIINIGLSYVDCLTGDNGIMDISNNSIRDTAIPFDELLKILTIKKPNEIVIHLVNCDIKDEDLINAIHLFKYNFKIIRNNIDDKFENIKYQRELFEQIYSRQKGNLDILQQLDLDNMKFIYARVSLCLLLSYILKHDKSVINKLTKPQIIVNSVYYLMLANNCLEQLDIIDNLKYSFQNHDQYGLGRRISLCELLDKTKTTMGKRKFRQRLSIPITNEDELNKRYNEIDDLIKVENTYFKYNTDIFGSPISQIRNLLFEIKNIDNFMRKMITDKFHPYEMEIYYNSVTNCINLINLINKIKSEYNSLSERNDSLKYIQELIPSKDVLKNINELLIKIKDEIIFNNCSRIWIDIENNIFKKGLFPKLDDIQKEIDLDKNLVNSLIIQLSKLIQKDFDFNLDKPIIHLTDNAKLGVHLYTNTTKKDQLNKIMIENKNKVIFKIGSYTFYGKDITFLKMKESKWQISIAQLKISGGSLKQNIEYLVQITKKKFKEWTNGFISKYINYLEQISDFVSSIDVIQSISYVSMKNGYVKPIIEKKKHSYIEATQIRHPIIEFINKNTKYVPNDIRLGFDDQTGILLFGINAVGKSSCMKSIGINVIMAQAGMYVACDKMV